MTNDVSRAYLHSSCMSDVYVQRCDEDLNQHYNAKNLDNSNEGGDMLEIIEEHVWDKASSIGLAEDCWRRFG